MRQVSEFEFPKLAQVVFIGIQFRGDGLGDPHIARTGEFGDTGGFSYRVAFDDALLLEIVAFADPDAKNRPSFLALGEVYFS